MLAFQKSVGMAVVSAILFGCGGGGSEEAESAEGPEGSAAGQAQPAQPSNEVRLLVTCNGQRVDLRVVPWRTFVRPGEVVNFTLIGGTTASSLTIEKKAGGPDLWPFETVSSITVGQNGGSTDPAPDPGGGVLENQYQVRAECSFPGNAPNGPNVTREVIIDPDLIVRGSPIRNDP